MFHAPNTEKSERVDDLNIWYENIKFQNLFLKRHRLKSENLSQKTQVCYCVRSSEFGDISHMGVCVLYAQGLCSILIALLRYQAKLRAVTHSHFAVYLAGFSLPILSEPRKVFSV